MKNKLALITIATALATAPSAAQANSSQHLSLRTAEQSARFVHQSLAEILIQKRPGSAPIIVHCARVSMARAKCRVAVVGTTQTVRDITHVEVRNGQGHVAVWSTNVTTRRRR